MQTNHAAVWEDLYVAAVLETDPNKIVEKISLAQDALRERWHELREVPLARDREKQRVEDAIRTLNMIRVTELERPM